MALTVKLSEMFWFTVSLELTQPDEEAFATRVGYVNDAIKSGFKIGHEEVIQSGDGHFWLLVTLVRYPKEKTDELVN